MPTGGHGSTAPASAGGYPRPPAGPPEQVRAGPLLLRRVRPEDAAALAATVAASLDHLRPWMPWAGQEAADCEAQRARAAEAAQLWHAGSDYIYSVFTAADGTLVGAIGLHRRAGEDSMEIGYWIAAGHTRRGYATAAAGALTPVAASLPGVRRVEIHCDVANTASAGVPRKLGYRLDRIISHDREAPGEVGQRMIWVWQARPGGDGGGAP